MKKLTLGAATVLLLTFILDFFVHQHVKFGPEDMPGFYGLLAFAGSGITVLAAVVLPWLLRSRPAVQQEPDQKQPENAVDTGETASD